MKLLFFPTCLTQKSGVFLVATFMFCIVVHLWIVDYAIDIIDTMESILYIASRAMIPDNNTKYILTWNSLNNLLYKNGRDVFPGLNCSKKCEFTDNRYLFEGGYENFDAVLFNENDLRQSDKPEVRSPHQLYIFMSIESSHNHPACELYNDHFFNWTSTYRLDSTVPWNYFAILNRSGAVVAPRRDVVWEVSYDDLKPEIKAVLSRKTKTAAWLVSHCMADSLRDEYLTKLQEHLFHFSLKIDVFGKCTKQQCDNNDCEEMLKDNYYFYLAFENSISEDYVTEKVLHGYRNFAVPIVYGGANYSRFLPQGSYINAREIHPYHLAYTMSEMVKNPKRFEEFFGWTNLYTVSCEMLDVRPYFPHQPILCDLCKALHDNGDRRNPAMKRFRIWWNGVNGMKWCLSDEYWKEIADVSIDLTHVS